MVRLQFEHNFVIVKHVKLPQNTEHPKGWNTDFSHQRKIHSYEVEVNWYEHFCQQQDERCLTPLGLKTFQSENEWLMVLQDLSTLGVRHVITQAKEVHLKSCLTWLAHFHAKYMHTNSELLWETGTYWHLKTRPDEFEALDDKELKLYAPILDNVLTKSNYQTLVHGDAKLANFCFNDDGTQCAAVDFQYVGHGCGMKDLIYFMSSAIEPNECELMESFILNTYFEVLDVALGHYQPQLDAQAIQKEYRSLYEIAWADFVRFLKGWSPSHYKINDYSSCVTQKAIEVLKKR